MARVLEIHGSAAGDANGEGARRLAGAGLEPRAGAWPAGRARAPARPRPHRGADQRARSTLGARREGELPDAEREARRRRRRRGASLRDDAPLDEAAPPAATETERSSVVRVKYRPDQARAPAGTSDGGQWVDEGGGSGGGASSSTRTLSDASSDDADFWKPGARVAQNDDGPPKVPKIRPDSGRERNRIIKKVAKWAGRYAGAVGRLSRV